MAVWPKHRLMGIHAGDLRRLIERRRQEQEARIRALGHRLVAAQADYSRLLEERSALQAEIRRTEDVMRELTGEVTVGGGTDPLLARKEALWAEAQARAAEWHRLRRELDYWRSERLRLGWAAAELLGPYLARESAPAPEPARREASHV